MSCQQAQPASHLAIAERRTHIERAAERLRSKSHPSEHCATGHHIWTSSLMQGATGHLRRLAQGRLRFAPVGQRWAVPSARVFRPLATAPDPPAAGKADQQDTAPATVSLADKLAAPFASSSLLGPQTGQASAGFTNRWAFVPPAMAAHLCIGAPWAWSALSPTLTREYGFVVSAASDWTMADTTWPMQLAFCMQGMRPFSPAIPVALLSISPTACAGVGAAVVGTWQVKAGMRASMVAGGCLFGGGMMVGSVGILLHSKMLLIGGAGFLAGSGIGTMCAATRKIRQTRLRPWSRL
jgi:hypothetical protein